MAWSATKWRPQITGAMRGWQRGAAIKPIIDFQLKPIKVFCLIVNILHVRICPSAWTPLTPTRRGRWRPSSQEKGGREKERERETVVGAWPKFVWRREGWRRWSRADQLSPRWSPVCSQLQPGYQLLELFGIGASIQHPQGGEEWKQSISKWDHLGHLNNCAHIINISSPALFMESMGVAAFNLRKWGRWRKGGGVTALCFGLFWF